MVMKKAEIEKWRRYGWLDGYEYLSCTKGDGTVPDDIAGNIIVAVYIADPDAGYRSFLDRQREMLEDNVSVLSYSPLDEPIVSPVYRHYFRKHDMRMVPDASGRLMPPESWIQWEHGFVSCVKCWWNELPNGTRIYTQSAIDWLQKKYK